jgi:hypothetical protein
MKKNNRFRRAAIASIFAPAVACCIHVHRVAICLTMLLLGYLSGFAQAGSGSQALLPADFGVSITKDIAAGNITVKVRATLLAGHDLTGICGWRMPLQVKLPAPGLTLTHSTWRTSFDSLTAIVICGNVAPYAYDANVHCWSRSALKGDLLPWVEWRFVIEGVHESGMPTAMIAGLIQVDVIDGLRLVYVADNLIPMGTIFEAFPNPCIDILHVRNTSGDRASKVLQVLDLKGDVLHTVALTADVQSIDLRTLPSGIYVLRMFQNGQLPYEQRLVKY